MHYLYQSTRNTTANVCTRALQRLQNLSPPLPPKTKHCLSLNSSQYFLSFHHHLGPAKLHQYTLPLFTKHLCNTSSRIAIQLPERLIHLRSSNRPWSVEVHKHACLCGSPFPPVSTLTCVPPVLTHTTLQCLRGGQEQHPATYPYRGLPISQ